MLNGDTIVAIWPFGYVESTSEAIANRTYMIESKFDLIARTTYEWIPCNSSLKSSSRKNVGSCDKQNPKVSFLSRNQVSSCAMTKLSGTG